MTSQLDRIARLLLIQGDDPSPLEDALLRLDVIARRIPSTLSVNAVYQCGLRDGREAFHKPHLGMRDHPQLGFPVWQYYGHSSAESTGINECAAWRIARALGTPWETLVPTSVMRWLPSESAVIGGWGALTRKGSGPSGDATPLEIESLCWPAAFFDCLIGQQDRHAGNQRYEAATRRLTLIDHGFSFPAGHWRFNQSVFLEQRHADGGARLGDDETDVLNQLPDMDVWEELSLMLRAKQMTALEWRRSQMLQSGQLLPVGPLGFAPA
jgi:hypothetical protein